MGCSGRIGRGDLRAYAGVARRRAKGGPALLRCDRSVSPLDGGRYGVCIGCRLPRALGNGFALDFEEPFQS